MNDVSRRLWRDALLAALVLALALPLGAPPPAAADEQELEDYGRNIDSSLIRAWEPATHIFVGKARSSQDGVLLAGAFPVTQTRFGVSLWLRRPVADADQGSGIDTYMAGGTAGPRILLPSHGRFKLEANRRYLVIGRRASETEPTQILDVMLIDDTRGISDSRGHMLGVRSDGRLAFSESPKRPVLRRMYFRCREAPSSKTRLPIGEAGLESCRLVSPEELRLRTTTRGETERVLQFWIRRPRFELPTEVFDVDASAALDAPTTCEGCTPDTDPDPRAWLGAPLRFERGPGISKGTAASWVQQCFDDWNHVGSWGRSATPIVSWAEGHPSGPTSLAAYEPDSKSGIAIADPDRPYPHRCGASTWNGCAYVWIDKDSREILEVDILIDPSRRAEHEFRSTLTHELGHALTFGHVCGYLSVMRSLDRLDARVLRRGTDRAADVVRMGDFACARRMLARFNERICTERRGSPRWRLHSFCDLASVPGYHPRLGHPCALRAADTPARTGAGVNALVYEGKVVTIRNVLIENRGNRPACNATLTFVLHTKEPKDGARVVGRYHFLDPIRDRVAAAYEIRMPEPWADVEYYLLSWHVSHNGTDETDRNDWATLRTESVNWNPTLFRYQSGVRRDITSLRRCRRK